MRDTAFIVHNTQMLLFSVSIIEQNNIFDKSYLIISGEFNNAKETYDRISIYKEKLGNIPIKFFESRDKVFNFIKENNIRCIFVDNDCSFKNYRLFNSLRKSVFGFSINVFEDGVGTYRTDLYSGLKKYIFNVLGVGTFMGGYRYTDSVYVLDPVEYRSKFPRSRKQIVQIQRGPLDILKQDIDFWHDVFPYENSHIPMSDVCRIYLSQWEIDSISIGDFLDSPCDKYIKPHPRLQGRVEIPNTITIGHGVPAELILVDLADRYDVVTVYHHGSSTERYVKNERIEYVKI